MENYLILPGSTDGLLREGKALTPLERQYAIYTSIK